jgi:hypothetical protein
MGVSVTQSAQAGILFVWNDPSLEYLLKRYARPSGHQFRVLTTVAPELDVRALPPPTVASLALSPTYAQDGFLIAGTLEGGVYDSRDRGTNWKTGNIWLSGPASPFTIDQPNPLLR